MPMVLFTNKTLFPWFVSITVAARYYRRTTVVVYGLFSTGG
jgi:hypothetical protein